MKIIDINPWWKTAKIRKEYEELPKRDLFDEIVPYIKERQIIAVNGLRRTGKTVLMHHIIKELLKENPKENILYFNFDLFDKSIEEILNSYQKIVEIDIKKSKIFVFLDEIQKHQNWENELKVLYDNIKNIKFFISGSSSLFIESKTKESLGGRTFSFTLILLTFKEYLKLKKVNWGDKLSLYEKELKRALEHYQKTGGFPEMLEVKEKTKINRYIKELIIDRVIHIDIPKVFDIKEPELLVKILSIISAEPGMIIDYENLADDLGRNRKTISNYIFYLEKAFLVKKLYNHSKNLLTSEKKMKKIYPSSTAFAFLFEASTGKVAETTIMMNYDFRFFSRKGDKEVDFIQTEEEILPIEAKYQEKIKAGRMKGIQNFMKRFEIKKGIIITKDTEKEETINGKQIKHIPLWKWLLN